MKCGNGESEPTCSKRRIVPPGLRRVYIALISFSGVGIEQRHMICEVVRRVYQGNKRKADESRKLGRERLEEQGKVFEKTARARSK